MHKSDRTTHGHGDVLQCQSQDSPLLFYKIFKKINKIKSLLDFSSFSIWWASALPMDCHFFILSLMLPFFFLFFFFPFCETCVKIYGLFRLRKNRVEQSRVNLVCVWTSFILLKIENLLLKILQQNIFYCFKLLFIRFQHLVGP